MSVIPTALFNSKALFNPYQYKPFFACMEKGDKTWTWNGKNVFITDEVGVGKTFEAGIILQELLRNNPNMTVLIVCPARLCANWERELRENFYIAPVNYRVAKNFGQITILPYSYFRLKKNQENLDELEQAERELQEDSYDGNECDITELEYDVLLLDEAHYIRNDGALHQYIRKLIEQNEQEKNKFKIFMTATPIFNSENDYVNITSLLEYKEQPFATTTTLQGEANCYDFQLNIHMAPYRLNYAENVVMDDIYQLKETEDGKEVSKYGKLTGFLKRISASSFFSLREFVNSRESWEDEDNAWEEYSNEINLDELKRLCNNWDENKDSKFNTLQKLLGECLEISNKAVIFSCFLHTCDYLERRLKENYVVYTITGKTPAKTMEKMVTDFRNAAGKTILICSDAVKEGQNFQFCQHLIHYDFPFTPAAMGQRNGRIYRKGQEGIPNVYYIFGEATYDERLFGEIIVTKARIIKDASEQGYISTLNVLPQDSVEYFENSIQAYFEDLVEQRKRDTKQKDTRGDSYTLEQAVLRSILLKQFSHMEGQDKDRKRIWDMPEAEKIYGQNLPDSESCCNQLINILLESLPKDQGKSLALAYQEKYERELINFNENVFACQDDNFVGHGGDYLKNCGIEFGGQKFCHHMLTNTEITLAQYRKQFKPLKKLLEKEKKDDNGTYMES